MFKLVILIPAILGFLVIVTGIIIFVVNKTQKQKCVDGQVVDKKCTVTTNTTCTKPTPSPTPQSDFTPYCYDYNDIGSSPYLRPPYKMKLYYTDLFNTKTTPQTGGIDITSQDESTVQICNNTSENPLHVFLQCGSTTQNWNKVDDGPGAVSPSPVDWSKGTPFDPLGADIFQEVIIPKNSQLILQIPDGFLTKQGTYASRIFAIHMKNSSNDFLTLNDRNPQAKLSLQQPILVEGGKDVVADMSAVDGINFKVRYELTSDNNQVMVMNILQNPCDGISTGGMDIGCANPVKTQCATGATTCDCKEDQICRFNDCSQTLFNIPDNLKQYIGTWDTGNKYPPPPVKTFINKSSNLQLGSDLRKFCYSIQSDYKNKQNI